VWRAFDLTIEDSILWGNAGEDILDPPADLRIMNTLTEAPQPGPGNISGMDPLFVAGPGGDAYLSQVASGQSADSPALDAGDRTAAEGGLSYRTTRTDATRDAGTVDLGFHYEPESFTLYRGTDPRSLPPHLTGIVLPVLDPGAFPSAGIPVLYYSVDTDETILLRRSGADIDIRFEFQTFD
jgi:hypothetical protein